jgi:cysteine synthase A
MDASSATRAVHRPGRGRVFDSIVDAIGDTPTVALRKLPQAHGVNATILAKLEYFNPAASVKDRIGAAMVIAMEKAGVINVDTVLIEPTRHNAAASVAASRWLLWPNRDAGIGDVDRAGARCLCARRRDRADAGSPGHEGSDVPPKSWCERPNAAAPQQNCKPGQPEIHRRSRRDSGTTPAATSPFVAGVGTGGTITGVGVAGVAQARVADHAVEPRESPVLGGQHGRPQ